MKKSIQKTCQAKFPDYYCGTIREFYGRNDVHDGIWLSIFNKSGAGKLIEPETGIEDPRLVEFTRKYDLESELYDAGTLFLYELE